MQPFAGTADAMTGPKTKCKRYEYSEKLLWANPAVDHHLTNDAIIQFAPVFRAEPGTAPGDYAVVFRLIDESGTFGSSGDFRFNLRVIPEPTGASMALLGGAILILSRRRDHTTITSRPYLPGSRAGLPAIVKLGLHPARDVPRRPGLAGSPSDRRPLLGVATSLFIHPLLPTNVF